MKTTRHHLQTTTGIFKSKIPHHTDEGRSLIAGLKDLQRRDQNPPAEFAAWYQSKTF